MDEKAEEVVRMEEEAKEEADSEGQCSVNMVRFLSYILFSLALTLALVASGFYANKHQSRNLAPRRVVRRTRSVCSSTSTTTTTSGTFSHHLRSSLPSPA